MTLRIRQIVLAARDLESTVEQLQKLFALQVAYRDPMVAEFGLHNALMPIGDHFLEVVSPTRAGTAAGRLLDRRGDSGYMLILQTDDFDRDRTRFDRLGVRIVWQAAYPDIRAAHLHPKDIGGAIVSVDQPTPAHSWRWAGPDWQRFVSRAAPQTVLGVEIETHEPQLVAERWAEVLALGGPEKVDHTWRLSVTAGELRFVEAGPRGDGIGAFTLAVANPDALVAAAQTHGIATAGRSVTLCGTRFNLVSAA